VKAALIFLLKLALTVGCLWWAFSGVEGEESVLGQPGKLDFTWLAGGAVLAGLSMVLTAFRWWIFLRVQRIRITVARAIELTMIGNLFSLISIGSLGGDAARIILLIRDQPGRKLAITMSVLVDHMAGMVTTGLWFFFISAQGFDELTSREVLGTQGANVLKLAWMWIGGGFLLVTLFFICASPPIHRRIHANGRMLRWPMMRQIPEIYDTYRRNWKLTGTGLIFSAAMMLAYFASFWCGMRAVGGAATLGSVMTAMPVIDGLSAIPVSVGGIGIRENLFMLLMPALADVSRETARNASLAGFGCNVLWALLGAAFFLKKRDRISAEDIRSNDH
jgi:uncharacterized membrane protein YbhN (UPF0104 family)